MRAYEVEWIANGREYSKTVMAITSKDAVAKAKNEGIPSPKCDKIVIAEIHNDKTIDYSYINN